jgi:hypothetical protein
MFHPGCPKARMSMAGNSRRSADNITAQTQTTSVSNSRSRKRRMIRGLVAIAILVIVMGGVSMTLLFHENNNTSLPPLDPATSAWLEARLTQARVNKAAGKPSVISLDEKEVSALLDRMLQTRLKQAQASGKKTSTSLRDCKIRLRDDIMRAHFLLDVHGTEMSFDVEGKLYTENGYIRFVPIGGALGDLPIPRALLEAAVRQMASSAVALEKMRLSPSLSDLRVENRSFVLTYK